MNHRDQFAEQRHAALGDAYRQLVLTARSPWPLYVLSQALTWRDAFQDHRASAGDLLMYLQEHDTLLPAHLRDLSSPELVAYINSDVPGRPVNEELEALFDTYPLLEMRRNAELEEGVVLRGPSGEIITATPLTLEEIKRSFSGSESAQEKGAITYPRWMYTLSEQHIRSVVATRAAASTSA